jgi:hypothetical protein
MSATFEPDDQQHSEPVLHLGGLGWSGRIAIGVTLVAFGLVTTAAAIAAVDQGTVVWWPLLAILAGVGVVAAFGIGLVRLLAATADERRRDEPQLAPAPREW